MDFYAICDALLTLEPLRAYEPGLPSSVTRSRERYPEITS
jgi:hypothetical protein